MFDASPERRAEILHNTALRGEHTKGHAATIEREVRKMIENWGDSGEIDLLEFFAELTIYTSTSCDRHQFPQPARLAVRQLLPPARARNGRIRSATSTRTWIIIRKRGPPRRSTWCRA